MEPSAYVDAVRTESEALILAVGAGAMDVPVPTCEPWEVRDLAIHVGGFCGFWSHVLCEATGRPKPPFPDPPEGEHTRRVAGRPLLSTWSVEFQATPPETSVWTWFDADHSAAFVMRRSAHEIAIHRLRRPGRARDHHARPARARCRRHRRDPRRAGHRPAPHGDRHRSDHGPPIDRPRARMGGDHRRRPNRGGAAHPGRSHRSSGATSWSTGACLRPRAHPLPPPHAGHRSTCTGTTGSSTHGTASSRSDRVGAPAPLPGGRRRSAVQPFSRSAVRACGVLPARRASRTWWPSCATPRRSSRRRT